MLAPENPEASESSFVSPTVCFVLPAPVKVGRPTCCASSIIQRFHAWLKCVGAVRNITQLFTSRCAMAVSDAEQCSLKGRTSRRLNQVEC